MKRVSKKGNSKNKDAKNKITKKITKKVKLDFIELFAFGVAFSSPESRPVLIFKDADEELAMPVWVPPVEASLVLEEVSPQSVGDSPHATALKLLSGLDVVIEKCVFTELVGHHQYVELFIKGYSEFETLRCRADHVMSFCLHHKVRFFSQRSLMESCRDLQADMKGAEEELLAAQRQGETSYRYLM